MNRKINQPLVEIIGEGKPVIGIVGAMHGNEAGPMIIEELRKSIKLKKGTIKFIIANPEAREKQVRFVDEDLNRAFPGNNNGNTEQQLAQGLIAIGKDIDYLIDLHSCSMESAPFAIIRSKNGQDMDLARKSGLPFIVIYPLGTQGGGSYIDYVMCGIGLELGLHKKQETLIAGLEATCKILQSLGVIEFIAANPTKQKVLQVIGHIQKEEGMAMSNRLANFRKVRQGEVIGTKNGKTVRADKDFYPVLYKEKAYTDNLGWMAKEIRV